MAIRTTFTEESQEAEWRVTFQARPDRRAQVERMARIFTEQVTAVDAKTVICYFEDEASARGALTEQFDDALEGFEFSRWNSARETWAVLDQAGHVAVRSMVPADVDARRRAVVLSSLGFFVVAFLFLGLGAYWIPGASGTPLAGRHHDIGKAIGVGLAGGAVCTAVRAFRRRH